jgi:acetate kinase
MNKDDKLLVINAGSTAVKYKLFNYKGGEILSANFPIKSQKAKKEEEKFLQKVRSLSKKGILKIAFRVVHGGDIKKSQPINSHLIKKIKEFTIFAPIHNKIFLKKISKVKRFFPKEYERGDF